MAFLDDILGGGQRLSIGEDGGDPIVLDASVREVHSVSGQVSEHPVEKGIDIVDHYRVLPRGIEIEGIVTNTPIVKGIPGATLVNSVVGLIQGDTDPASNAWNELQRFFDDAVVVVITTSLRTYENMVITDLSVTRNTKQAQGIFFVATAREVRFVDTEVGEAITIPTTPVGQKTKSAGKKTNAAANTAQGTQSSSLLKSFQGLGFMQ
jgi:hypothetical protein